MGEAGLTVHHVGGLTMWDRSVENRHVLGPSRWKEDWLITSDFFKVNYPMLRSSWLPFRAPAGRSDILPLLFITYSCATGPLISQFVERLPDNSISEVWSWVSARN